MAIIASGVKTRFAYVAEVTPGTTPSSPSFTKFPVTGGNLSATLTEAQIKAIYGDRKYRDRPQTSQGAGGTYNIAMAYGQFDDILASAMYGAWATNVLKDGVTRNFMSFEETEDVGGGNFLYHRFPMGIIDSFSIDVEAEKEVTGSFSVWSQKAVTPATSALASATYAAPAANPVLSAGVSVASLSLVSLSSPLVKKLSLSIKNTIRARKVVDSLYSVEPGDDMAEITGSVDIYTPDSTALQKGLTHATGVLSFNLGNAGGSTYTFNFPNIQVGQPTRVAGGPSGDAMVTLPFQALYDSSSTAQLVITRAV